MYIPSSFPRATGSRAVQRSSGAQLGFWINQKIPTSDAPIFSSRFLMRRRSSNVVMKSRNAWCVDKSGSVDSVVARFGQRAPDSNPNRRSRSSNEIASPRRETEFGVEKVHRVFAFSPITEELIAVFRKWGAPNLHLSRVLIFSQCFSASRRTVNSVNLQQRK